MSDISIPGFSNQNSTIDTERVIADLLELERIPITRIESSINEYEQQKEIWQDISRGVTQLADNAALLFNFQNPFSDRVGTSSNEDALTLTVARGTDESTHHIEIVQNAGRDRFLSNDIARDYQVSPGTYTFMVGEKEVSLNFAGGSMRSFSRRINAIDPQTLTTQVVQKSDVADTILFESQIYGKNNTLAFLDHALQFAQEHGVVAYQEIQEFKNNQEYTVTPATEVDITLNEEISLNNAQFQLSFTALLENTNNTPLEQFAIQSSGSITLQNVTVPNVHSTIPLSKAETVIVDNSHPTFMYLVLKDGTDIPIGDIESHSEPYDIHIALPATDSPLTALTIRNENTHQILTVSDIRISRESDRMYRPLHALEEARDAIVKLDGIEVIRSENTITDLLPGVSLDILATESKELEISIAPDYENVKNSIINFVGSYNQLIRDLNILARNNEQIIDEIEYFTDEEREQARARLGIMQGETALTQLRSQLINFTQNPYPTSAGREINLLSQIGIATNAAGVNSGGFSQSRLRGYLELDESQFDAAIKEHFDAVKELFGNDTDQDLVVDSGLAYQIDGYVDLYIQNGGVIQIRTNGLDNRIEQSNTRLTTHNEKLETYERKLRSDFGRMQGALNSLDDTTRSLDNLQTQQ